MGMTWKQIAELIERREREKRAFNERWMDSLDRELDNVTRLRQDVLRWRALGNYDADPDDFSLMLCQSVGADIDRAYGLEARRGRPPKGSMN